MKGKIVYGVIIAIAIATTIYYVSKKDSLSKNEEVFSSRQNEKRDKPKENIKKNVDNQETSYEEEASQNANIKAKVSEDIKERHAEAAGIMRESIQNIVSENNTSSVTENEADLAEMDSALDDLLDE